MISKRQAIESFRKKLQEQHADSDYANQFLYNALMEQGRWLIKREISSGRIYKNTSFFRTMGCADVIETSLVDECCPIKTNCKIYRTKHKLADMWLDNDGPVIKSVTSVDGSTDFFLTTPTTWQSKDIDPYQAKSSQKYAFYADGYLWFPKHNPHLINISAFWTDDVTSRSGCNRPKKCVRFLDTEFMVPAWLHAEMYTKALQLMSVTKSIPEDEQIDKNANRKN